MCEGWGGGRYVVYMTGGGGGASTAHVTGVYVECVCGLEMLGGGVEMGEGGGGIPGR